MNLSDSLHQAGERRGPDHDLLGEPRQMHRVIAAAASVSSDEVAVGYGVERIGHRPVEAERLRGHVAVERKRGAGKRRGAERRFVQPLARVGKPAAVARRHLDIGEQMMAEGHRLRRLQMGEAGHHRAGMRQRLLGERALVSRRARHRARRWCRAPTAGNRSPPGRCASARYAAGRPPRRSARTAGLPRSCGCLPAPA